MKVRIKNMVCPRCIMVVEDIFRKAGLTLSKINLGEAELEETLSEAQYRQLGEALHKVGFELMDNREESLVERIRQLVRQRVRQEAGDEKSLPALLENALHMSYPVLNRVFLQTDGRTIERYFLLQRIEYVKELLQYGELSVKEIAWRTGYSSLPHLSRQFKQITGMTPTDYKAQQHVQARRPLDSV